MNSRSLQAKLSSEAGRVHELAASSRTPTEIATELYLAALGRLPTEDELRIATDPFGAATGNRQTATEDLLWALLNSAEFLFNH